MYIDLKQINIEQNGIERNILDIMADQYAPKIQEELNKRWCCSPEKHEHIYTILARRGAENILKYSVEQMRDLIIELNNWELWSTFSSQGCGITKKDGITPFVSCSNCSLMKGIGQWKGTGKTCKQYDILKEIQTIFDYDNWCSDDNVDFKPYDFIKSLNIKACPYCNLEYVQTTTLNGRNKTLRPALDHFYPQSKYPFFALSLYNLVPSCTICNTYIKGDNEISTYNNCIHPYEKDINYHENIRYKVCKNSPGIKKIKRIIQSDQGSEEKEICNLNGEWKLMDCEPPEGEKVPGGYKRALENFKYFEIQERLEQGFSDYISEIYQKTLEYPELYIDFLIDKGYSPLEIYRLLFANYIIPEDFNKRPLSKITHDIFQQFSSGILKKLAQEISK